MSKRDSIIMIEKSKEKQLSIDFQKILVRLSQLTSSIHSYKKVFNDIEHSKRYKIGNKIVGLLRRFLPFFNIGSDTNFESANRVMKSQEKIFLELQKEITGLKNRLKLMDNNSSFQECNYFPIIDNQVTPNDHYFYSSVQEKSTKYLSKLSSLNIEEDLKFSVIMPVYNRRDVIKESIDSVLSQSYSNFELIIIDDGSTDDLSNVIQEYSDPRIKFFQQSNSGVSSARNLGLKNAKSDLIAYLDSDNTWDKHFLKAFANLFRDGTIKTAYSWQRVYDINETNSELGIRANSFYSRVLENRNYIDLNCFVHRKELVDQLGSFNTDLKRLVDWELIIRYTNNYYPRVIDCVLSDYFFNKSDNQITNNLGYNNNLQKVRSLIIGEPLKQNIFSVLPEKYSDGLYCDISPCDYKLSSNEKLSIIIPSYEVLDCLKAAVIAIETYTPSDHYELIIVDNNSSSEVKNYLSTLQKEGRAKVILNQENMGFTYAVNQGIKASTSGYDLLLFNNDAIVTKGWFNAFYMAKRDNPKAGLIVPSQILPANTKTQDVHVPFCNTGFEVDVNLSIHHNNIISKIELEDDWYMKVSFAAFFCVLITRECFNDLGFLDHVNGRHYKSDRLYCELAKEKGWDMIYTPKSKVYHLLQQATTNLKKNKDKYKVMFVDNKWEGETPQL